MITKIGNTNCDNRHSQDPLVSVIVPVYNVKKYLSECLDSIVGQNYQNMEIILVDDGSTDGSGAICDEYAERDERIIVIHQNNGGLSAARNSGLARRKGSILIFVDSDDGIEQNFVWMAVTLLQKENLDGVMVEASLLDENGTVIGSRFHVYDRYTVLPSKKVFELIITDSIGSQVWKCAYRSSCWDNIEFPVGRFYEDMATTFKVFENMTRPVAFLPECMYKYRLNREGISLSPKNQPLKMYHIFLAQREQFWYSRNRCKQETTAICFKNASLTASRVVLWFGEKTMPFQQAYQFIYEERKRILGNQYLGIKARTKLVIMALMPNGPKIIKFIGRIMGHKYGE